MAPRLFDPAAHAIDAVRQQALRRVETLADLPACFSRRKDIGPDNAAGWVFTWRQPDGSTVPQFRPDNPPLDEHGKPIRYMSPPDTGGMLSVPPGHEELVRDPTVPLVIVEGSAQHLAVASAVDGRGVAVIGMVGCHGWSTGNRPTPQLGGVALRGREVLLLPDADMASNPGVWTATTQLAGHLKGEYLAQSVRFVSIPGHGNDGADDILGRHADHQHRGDLVMAWIEQATPEPCTPPPGRQPSYSELIQRVLDGIRHGGLDIEMAARAEIMQRFRVRPEQIDRDVFIALERERAPKGKRQPAQEQDSLDLTKIGGLDFQVDGFSFKGQLGLVVAKWGTGKTTAMLAMAFAHIEGRGFLDREGASEPGKVLFIAEDSGPGPVNAAMAELGLTDHPAAQIGPDQRFFLWSFDPSSGFERWGLDARGITRLCDFVTKRGITKVIIDSAKATCSNGGINYLDNMVVAQMLTTLHAVVCPHASVDFISHDGSNGEANAGAKAWAEFPSIVHKIEKVKDRPDVRKWTVLKCRLPGQEREFLYTLSDGQLVVADGVEVIKDCSDAIRQVMVAAFRRGQESLPMGELQADCLTRFNLAAKTVKNTCTKLTGASHPWIRRVGHGRYALSPKEQQRLQLEAKQGQGLAAAPAASEAEPAETPLEETGLRDFPPLNPSLSLTSSMVPGKVPWDFEGLSESPEQNGGTLLGTTAQSSDSNGSAPAMSPGHSFSYREEAETTPATAGASAGAPPSPQPPATRPDRFASLKAAAQAHHPKPQEQLQEQSSPKPHRAGLKPAPQPQGNLPIDRAAASLAVALKGDVLPVQAELDETARLTPADLEQLGAHRWHYRYGSGLYLADPEAEAEPDTADDIEAA